MNKKLKLPVFFAVTFFLITLAFLAKIAEPLLPSLFRPGLAYLYLTNPDMRDLMNLIAEDRVNAFRTVWDSSSGVMLSKKMFRPVLINGKTSYAYLPNLKKLSFETGVPGFLRKFEAPDSPRLRGILEKLATKWIMEADFNEYGFRRTGFENLADCTETVLFAGDSFTEGLWVRNSDTFASVYARDLNRAGYPTCVFNSGTNGYGIVEESFAAREFYKKVPYQTLFLIHYPNDIAPDAFGVLRQTVPELESKWQEHLSHLKDLAEFTRKNKIRLILVPIPPKEQFAMPETTRIYQQKLKKFCEQEAVEFWNPFDAMSPFDWNDLYLDWDPHLNASGHRFFAGFLKEKTLTSKKPEI